MPWCLFIGLLSYVLFFLFFFILDDFLGKKRECSPNSNSECPLESKKARSESPKGKWHPVRFLKADCKWGGSWGGGAVILAEGRGWREGELSRWCVCGVSKCNGREEEKGYRVDKNASLAHPFIAIRDITPLCPNDLLCMQMGVNEAAKTLHDVSPDIKPWSNPFRAANKRLDEEGQCQIERALGSCCSLNVYGSRGEFSLALPTPPILCDLFTFY